MNNLKITIEFWREGNLYIANCPELDMLAQGSSLDEARENLFEVVEIQCEEMKELGTLDEFLKEMGWQSMNEVNRRSSFSGTTATPKARVYFCKG